MGGNVKDYEDLINWLDHASAADTQLLSHKRKKICATRSARQLLKSS